MNNNLCVYLIKFLPVSLRVLAPAITIYSIIVPWLLHSFPKSFTLGEAVIIGQGATILLMDTALQLLKLVRNAVMKRSSCKSE